MFRLLTFAAFGGLGYAAYSFYQKNGRVPNLNELADTVKILIAPQNDTPQPARGDFTSVPIAGGPLSGDATLQADPEEPSANDPYSGNNVPPPAG
jgi:hypothetical protein